MSYPIPEWAKSVIELIEENDFCYATYSRPNEAVDVAIKGCRVCLVRFSLEQWVVTSCGNTRLFDNIHLAVEHIDALAAEKSDQIT